MAALGWMLPWPYRAYLTFVFRTSRVVYVNQEAFRQETRAAGGGVLAFFHECMLLAPYGMRHLDVVTMTTRVDAGTLIAGILKHFGYVVVRTRKRDGAGAMRDLLNAMRANPGHALVLAVDGPSGPRRQIKPGGVLVARRLKLPVWALHITTARGVPNRSWDRCNIPLPFNRVVARFERVVAGEQATTTSLTRALQRTMDANADAAEGLVHTRFGCIDDSRVVTSDV